MSDWLRSLADRTTSRTAPGLVPVHEWGHVAGAVANHVRVVRVELLDDGGETEFEPWPTGDVETGYANARLVIALAGQVAERHLAARGGGYLFTDPRDARGDDESSMRLATLISSRTGRNAFMVRQAALEKAQDLVERHAGAILAGARELNAAGGILEGEALDRALDRVYGSAWRHPAARTFSTTIELQSYLAKTPGADWRGRMDALMAGVPIAALVARTRRGLS